MNFGEMKSSVQVTLARHGIWPSETQLGIWVRDAHVAIDSILSWTRTVEETSSEVGTASYAVPSGMHKIVEVTYDDKVLEEIGLRDYLRLVKSVTGNGTPDYWCLWGSQIYLHRPPDAVKTIGIWSVVKPTALSDAADEPAFPQEFHRAVVDYALMVAYADSGLVQESLGYRMLWEKAVQRTASLSGVELQGPSRVEAKGG